MVRHILADGTEVRSMAGRTVPSTGNTAAVYRLVAELLVKKNLDKKEALHGSRA